MLDPADFAARFKSSSLGPVGSLMPRCLLAWAASYGVDERGDEEVVDPTESAEQARARRRRECDCVVEGILMDVDSLR